MTDIFSKESIKNQICVMLQKQSRGVTNFIKNLVMILLPLMNCAMN